MDESEPFVNKTNVARTYCDQNIALLKKYKLFWSKNTIKDYDHLKYHIHAINDYEYRLYDCQEDKFTETVIDIKSEKKMKYFFSDLSKPIFVENEINAYNLEFLFNHVRRSEDC